MQLILYETIGHWAAALRRELPQEVSVVETRSLSEFRQRLADSPPSIVGIEIAPSQLEGVLDTLKRLSRDFPQTMPLVMADRSLAACDELLREAGAAHVVYSPRQVDEIAAVVRRRLAADHPNDFNAEKAMSLEERILANLPWSEHVN